MNLESFFDSGTFPQWGIASFERVPLLPVRARARIPQGAASVIVLLFGYYTEPFPARNVARYAIPDDYHTTILPLLQERCDALALAFPGEAFVPFVDASPIDEVSAAVQAGLGCVGKNHLLLTQRYGSYCFIGEIVTTLALPQSDASPPALCSGCDACVQACPSGALSAEGFLKENCRSHISQKKGALSDWEAQQLREGGFVWGCDRCVDACPQNRCVQKSETPAFWRNPVSNLTWENLNAVLEHKSYAWRTQTVLERNLSLFDENAKRQGEK